MTDENKNLHDGHRERLREKYIATGGDTFTDHEMLELALFYAIPRSNTNDIAHALLDRFGSLEGVISAAPENLAQIDGIGEHSAIFLSLIGEFLRRVARASVKPKKKYTCLQDAVDHLHRMFIGVAQERIYLMMFDNGMRLIDTVELARGAVNHVSLDPHRLMKEALLCNASAVLIAHNHPDGEPRPSEDDLRTTDRIQYLLSTTGITLLDHLIFSGGSYTSILHPPAGEIVEIEDDFYEAYRKMYDGEAYSSRE